MRDRGYRMAKDGKHISSYSQQWCGLLNKIIFYTIYKPALAPPLNLPQMSYFSAKISTNFPLPSNDDKSCNLNKNLTFISPLTSKNNTGFSLKPIQTFFYCTQLTHSFRKFSFIPLVLFILIIFYYIHFNYQGSDKSFFS